MMVARVRLAERSTSCVDVCLGCGFVTREELEGGEHRGHAAFASDEKAATEHPDVGKTQNKPVEALNQILKQRDCGDL